MKMIAGENFLKKVFPCTPFKNFCTKISKENSKETDRQATQVIKTCFCCRNFVGATETLQNKRVVLHQSGSPKGLPYRLFFMLLKSIIETKNDR